MSLSPQPKSDLLDLLAEVCEGTTGDPQSDRLRAIASENLHARQLYIRHMHLAASLRWEFDGENLGRWNDLVRRDIEEDTTVDSNLPPCLFAELTSSLTVHAPLFEDGVNVGKGSEPSVGSETINLFDVTHRKKLRTGFALPPRLVGFAASLLLASYFVAMAGLLIWNRVRQIDDHQHRGMPSVAKSDALPAERTMAILTDMTNCDWENESQKSAAYIGRQLGADSVLAVRSGVAQVTFGKGAVVHVEGPARFFVRSSERGFLECGRLLAQVPQRAIGFCVSTPTMEVIDLGTEFGVQTDEEGTTEVQVFHGRVEVEPAATVSGAGDRVSAQRVQLSEGQKMVGNARGLGGVATADSADRYSRLTKSTRLGFSRNPGWTGAHNTTDGNNYGWVSTTRPSGIVDGRIGGTFARCRQESSFGDTKLSRTFTLNDPISASGSFVISDASKMNGQLFVGHFSSSTADDRREFIGIELKEGDVQNIVKVYARMYPPNGKSFKGDTLYSWLDAHPNNGIMQFMYKYDPTFEVDAKHPGPEGKISVRIFNELRSVNYSDEVVLDRRLRDSGATFDAFGIGIAMEAVLDDDPAKIAEIFFDNLNYSGYRGEAQEADTR